MENTIESHQQKQSNSISVFDFMIYWEKNRNSVFRTVFLGKFYGFIQNPGGRF